MSFKKRCPSSQVEILNGSLPSSLNSSSGEEDSGPYNIKLVDIKKLSNEPLGITLKIESGDLVVARILGGGVIDQLNVLRVGDVIREVNGNEVETPEQVQYELRKAGEGSITMKIVSTAKETPVGDRAYVRAMYNYDPKKDTLLPCPEIGLTFKSADIIEVMNTQDPNWWQAKTLSNGGLAGLIPSPELEERRKAFVRPEYNYSTRTSICGTRVAKKKIKQFYLTKESMEFEKAELLCYEEVTQILPIPRKLILLIGAEGVGRRSVKTSLLSFNPDTMATVIPHTSRPQREDEMDGQNYHFARQEDMEADINAGLYLEHGENNGHLYGIPFESIREVMRSGKTCILDCNPQSLKFLRTPEFMPLVIFIAAPSIDYLRVMHGTTKNGFGGSFRNLSMSRNRSRRAQTMESLATFLEEDDLRKITDESGRLQRSYEKYFDIIVSNEDSESTTQLIIEDIASFGQNMQWVPTTWVY